MKSLFVPALLGVLVTWADVRSAARQETAPSTSADKTILASTNFDRGNSAPFVGANGTTTGNQDIVIMDDPTGQFEGKVARIEFRRSAPRQGPDVNRALRYTVRPGVGLGETVFLRGDVLIPTPQPGMESAMRKLIYVQRQPNDQSFAVIKADGRGLKAEITRNRVFHAGANSFPFDRKIRLEVQITTNSIAGMADGALRIWTNGNLVVNESNVMWLNSDRPFKVFMFGQQTQHKRMDRKVLFDEFRYWDNLAIATKRITGDQ